MRLYYFLILWCWLSSLFSCKVERNEPYIELTTDLNIDEQIVFGIKTKAKSIWVDVNNNQRKDKDEIVKIKSPNKEVTIRAMVKSNVIRVYGDIYYLGCPRYMELTDINVSNNKGLTHLYLDTPELSTLDVSQNKALEFLHCSRVGLPEGLDVSHNVKLKTLECASNYLDSLDVSKNTNLIELTCYNNHISSLDLSKNKKLKYLDCGDTRIHHLDISKNMDLEKLFCENLELEELDISQHTVLKRLRCGGNNLKSLDVSKNTNLYELDVTGNEQLSCIKINNKQKQDLKEDETVWYKKDSKTIYSLNCN